MKKVFAASGMAVSTAFLLAAVLLLVMAGCNVSTANLSNVKICDKIEGDQCSSDMSSLDTETATFFVTADLNSAPSDTKIRIDWRYLGGEAGSEVQDIDSITVISKDDSNNLQSSLDRSTASWPRGEYEVVLKIETDNADPIHKKFSVK